MDRSIHAIAERHFPGKALLPLGLTSKFPASVAKGWNNPPGTDPYYDCAQPLPKTLTSRQGRELPLTGYGVNLRLSNLVVVDLDVNHERKDGTSADGIASWKALLAERGVTVPRTLTSRTMSGGYHLWFSAPDGVQLPTLIGKLGEGIDFKASGMVVGPGTAAKKWGDDGKVISEGTYEVHLDEPIAEAPQWLIELVQDTHAATSPPAYEYEPSDSSAENAARALHMLAKAIGEVQDAPKGRGNETLNKKAAGVFGAFAGAGLDPQLALTQLEQAYLSRGGHAPAEARATLQSALTFGRTHPNFAEAKPQHNNRQAAPKAEMPSRLRGDKAGAASKRDRIRSTNSRFSNYRPEDFFVTTTDKDGKEKVSSNLLTQKLADAVIDLGPIVYGIDGLTYEYKDGSYRKNPAVVEGRMALLLGDRFRGGYTQSVEPMVRVSVDRMDFEPMMDTINFRNGLLNWKAGMLTEHTPDFHSTVQLKCDWNPEATCPQFDAFLRQVVPEDVIPTMWEVIGYSLMSGNPLQSALMLVGEGGNGKGTFLRVIQGLVGRENIAAVSLQELSNDRFATADLFGKLANIAADIDGTFIPNTAEFKKMTGGDPLRAQLKGKDAFEFTCWAFPMYSANTIPGSADTTDGYFRRWLVIKFPYKIAQKDSGLDARLEAEYEGIAARSIRALRDLMGRGKGGEWDTSARSMEQAKREFEQKVDHIRDFLDFMTVHEPKVADCSSPIAVFDAYNEWCSETNHKHPLSKLKFYTRVEQAGHTRTVSQGWPKFTNLRLKRPEELLRELEGHVTDANGDDADAELEEARADRFADDMNLDNLYDDEDLF